MVKEHHFSFAPENPKSILDIDSQRTTVATEILNDYSTELDRIKKDLEHKDLNWEEVEAIQKIAFAGYGKEALDIVIPAYEKTPLKKWINMDPFLIRASNGYNGAKAIFSLLDKHKNNFAALGMHKEMGYGIFELAASTDERIRKEAFDRGFAIFKTCDAFAKKLYAMGLCAAVDLETSAHIFKTIEAYSPSYEDMQLLKPLLMRCADNGEAERVYPFLKQNVDLSMYFSEKDVLSAFTKNPAVAHMLAHEHTLFTEIHRQDTAFQAGLLYGGETVTAMQNIYNPAFFDHLILTPENTQEDMEKNIWRRARLAEVFLAMAETGQLVDAWNVAQKKIFPRFEKLSTYTTARTLSEFVPEKVWNLIVQTPELIPNDRNRLLIFGCASKAHKEEQLRALLTSRHETKTIHTDLRTAWDNLFFMHEINPMLNQLTSEHNAGDRGPTQDAFFDVIKTLPQIEQFFILRSVMHTGTASRELWKGLQTGTFNTKMYKFGSTLEFVCSSRLKKESGILFKHTIDDQSAQTWNTAHERGIPVAPIIRLRKQPEHATQVYSRFCGYACNFYEAFADEVNDADTVNLIWEIFEKRNQIIAAMTSQEDIHICHGHPHLGNATVEFIEKEYFKQFNNINTIPWKEDKIIFDPIEYLKDKDKYEIVVRLIDWDRAKILPKHKKVFTGKK